MKVQATTLWLVLGSTLTIMHSANARDMTLHFDLSDTRIYELIEPVRRACISAQIVAGKSLEEAIASAPVCVGQKLVLALEFERVIRVNFPSRITYEDLTACVIDSNEDISLLTCVRPSYRRSSP